MKGRFGTGTNQDITLQQWEQRQAAPEAGSDDLFKF
jgi:DNA-binding transcriptional regulator YiaG